MEHDTNIDALRSKGAMRRERASTAQGPEAWAAVNEGRPDFAFTWGSCWRQCVEYRVNDFDAEAGFYTDILGMFPMILSNDRGMFGTPDSTFCVTVLPSSGENPATPVNALAFEFMVENIDQVTAELEARGLSFDARPAREAEGSPLTVGTLRTPNGIRVTIWCFEPAAQEATASEAA